MLQMGLNVPLQAKADETPSLPPRGVSAAQGMWPRSPGAPELEGKCSCLCLACRGGRLYRCIKLPGFSSALLAEFISYPERWKNKHACEAEISINAALQRGA